MRLLISKPQILSISLLLLVSFSTQAAISGSFSSAKKKLYKKVYPNQGKTFYLQCDWQKKKVDLESCNLQSSFSTKHRKRALRTEAEHIIPASWMYKKNGQNRSCFNDAKRQGESARKYCQSHDSDYKNAHNDLVNLRPAVGQINAMRSNKPFGEKLSGQSPQTFNGNERVFKVSSRIALPDPSIRGDIARVAFYMSDTYGVTYSKRQLKVFKDWDQQDPVSPEEIALNKQIKKVQGKGNHFVLR